MSFGLIFAWDRFVGLPEIYVHASVIYEITFHISFQKDRSNTIIIKVVLTHQLRVVVVTSYGWELVPRARVN